MKNCKKKEISAYDTNRLWGNWATVTELASRWELSKRRVQQILNNYGNRVTKGYITFINTSNELVNTPVYYLSIITPPK